MRGLIIAVVCFAAGLGWAADAPEDLLKQAQQAERDGTLPRAVQSYEAFLKAFPDHSQAVEVHYRLAKCYDSLGQVDDMVRQLKAVTESDKKQFKSRADAFYMLGKYYASIKDYAAAVKTFETVLNDGAGLFEDEVLSLCGGYYAIQKKYDDAAAKFNLLKRRKDSPLAESAAYKTAVLWLNAGKRDLAVQAISDFADQYPNNPNIPDLLLQAADSFRNAKQFDKCVALCDQIKSRYPKSRESFSATVLLGLCYRDQKQFKEAAEIFDQVGKVKEPQYRAIAAEALTQSAELHFTELTDTGGAMRRYEDAAKLARDSESERKSELLELCYFRMGEYYFQQKNWAAAREAYLQLRSLGTKLNIAGRILQCEAELKIAPSDKDSGGGDVTSIQEKIKANPGTIVAAEGEVFLLDAKLNDALKRRNPVILPLAAEYEKLLTTYSREILAQDNLELYIDSQIATCYASSADKADLAKAIAGYEKVIALDPDNSKGFKTSALENLALTAEHAGDKPRSLRAYNELFQISKQKLDANKDDKGAERKAMDYLKSLVTRADTGDMVEQTIALTKKMIEDRGPLSDASREARFYLAELYWLKKDFSTAAKTYQEYVQVYGPKQDENGDFIEAPWKPSVDEKVEQLYEAAIRIAHCWYVQGHEQNLVKAYRWIVKNIPSQNKYMAEAQYALALELGKGKEGQTKEGKRKLAEAMWTNVVSSSMDFESKDFNKTLQYWVKPGNADFADVQQYVKNAILRAGQAYSEAGDHEAAAGIFEKYLQIYGTDGTGKKGSMTRHTKNVKLTTVEDEADTARYALGRELIATGNINKLATVWKPYTNGLRDSRFRISALRLLGYNAGKANLRDVAIEAYATILDEYGENETNKKDEIISLPASQRLRQGNYNWDGIRFEPPADLDLGEVRFALGYFYWKIEDWKHCAQTLAPFLTDTDLAKGKTTDRALFMLGQSDFKLFDPENGLKVMQTLIAKYPRFDAIEEAYVYAARGAVETKAWGELGVLTSKFATQWPNSDRKQRMDLYAALYTMYGRGVVGVGISTLRGLAQGETYEDVKADALYYLGLNELDDKPPRVADALPLFEKSVTVYSREAPCLEAAKCAVKLRQWDKAKNYLDRLLREYPQGNPAVVQEARNLMPQVMQEVAKQK